MQGTSYKVIWGLTDEGRYAKEARFRAEGDYSALVRALGTIQSLPAPGTDSSFVLFAYDGRGFTCVAEIIDCRDEALEVA